MSATVTIPVTPQAVRFVPASDQSRAARQYAEGVSYADRAAKVDEKNRPLHRFDALVELSGARLGTVAVESPTPLPDDLPLGVVFTPTGQAPTLTLSNNRQGFDLRASLRIEGYEPVKN